MADPAKHPMLRGDTTPEHPAPTSTRGLPVNDPTTIDGAVARFKKAREANPELDPGRPESLERPEAEPKTPEQPEPQEAAGLEPETPAPEGTEQPPQEAETASDTEPDASDSTQIQLDSEQLSELLGIRVDVGDDGSLSVQTKVEGQEGKATLEDLLTGYQSVNGLKKREIRVAEKDKSIDAKIAEYDKSIEGNHEMFTAIFNAVKQEVNPYANINWQQLKAESEAENDARYVTALAEYQQWEQRIMQLANQAHQHITQQRETVEGERKERLSERQSAQGELLMKAIPDWNEEKLKEVDAYARGTYGMTSEDLEPISHHHAYTVMAHKAMLYDQGLEKIRSQEVQKLPQVKLKPAGPKNPEAQANGRIGAYRKKLADTGDPEAFVDYIRAQRAAANQRNSRRQ